MVVVTKSISQWPLWLKVLVCEAGMVVGVFVSWLWGRATGFNADGAILIVPFLFGGWALGMLGGVLFVTSLRGIRFGWFWTILLGVWNLAKVAAMIGIQVASFLHSTPKAKGF